MQITKFTWVHIGQYGRCCVRNVNCHYVMRYHTNCSFSAGSISDGGVWTNTDLASDLADGTIDRPDPCALPGKELAFPYVFVGHEAFPLDTHVMRPYPRGQLCDESRIFNYRLSRARRTIENAFGILTARWQILHKPLRMKEQNADSLFHALVVLHNFIMTAEESTDPNMRMYAPPTFIDVEEPDGTVREGEWRRNTSPYFEALGRVGGNRANCTSYGLRDYLRGYFNSDIGYSQAPWQYDYACGRPYNPQLYY